MDRPRLFISLPVDPSAAKKIMADFSKFDLPWPKLKIVASGQMHLTLKFLGDTPLDDLPKIISVLDGIQLNLGQLDLIIDKPMIISPQHPQVIALCLEKNADLEKLQQNIEQALWQAGLANKDSRKNTPHLTLARVKKATTAEELAMLTNWAVKRPLVMSHFELVESVLSPRGPQYTTLQTFSL